MPPTPEVNLCIELELVREQPCWFVGYDVMHTSAKHAGLLMTSQTQAASGKLSALKIVFSRLPNVVFNKLYLYCCNRVILFLIPFHSLGSMMP